MCGIVGYIGNRRAAPIVVEGIRKLEYRGYDSCGVAAISRNNLIIRKDIGKIEQVNRKLKLVSLKGNIALGHTRWATCGGVTKQNAHPHTDCKGDIALVHNGIIENHEYLKKWLIRKGHHFKSQTDTEVIAHLIEEFYNGSKDSKNQRFLRSFRNQRFQKEKAVIKALKKIEGSYALGIIFKDDPNTLIAARNESPLILGVGKEENFLASDIPAILDHTKNVILPDDKEIAVLTKNTVKLFDLNGKQKKKKIIHVKWGANAARKAGFQHFMLKEIFEQPKAIEETINDRLKDSHAEIEKEIGLSKTDLKEIRRIIIVACGTSWHAGLVGEFMLEELAKIPVEVEYASEFRYRHPILEKNTLVIAISQSGETADTIAAMKEARRKGAKVMAICNVVGSTITRIAHGTLYTHAGPEIGVASTKAFTAQLTVLYLLTAYFCKLRRTLPDYKIKIMINALRKIPLQIEKILDHDKDLIELAKLYHHKTNAMYLGRGAHYPIALEGALKLKEISYIHAEGYPAAEMKHGPIALIDKNMPVVFIATRDTYTYKKVISNIEEVNARGGIIIVIATEGDKEIAKKADHIIYVPKTLYTLSSMLAVVPLQLLAYHIAVKRGKDPDFPANLAKSVTVE